MDDIHPNGDVSETNEAIRVPTPDANKDSYSLTIIIKSAVLDNIPENDKQMLELRMTLGDAEANLKGTLKELNEQHRGTAMSVPASNPDEFKQFLLHQNLLINIIIDAVELGRANISLATTNLASFDPPDFEPTIVNGTFTINCESSEVGKIIIVLKTDRVKSSTHRDGSVIEEDNSMLYIVNDPERHSSEYQDDIMKQLLTCRKCSVLKSPSEASCKYELIDGILTITECPRKDPDLDAIKRKVEHIARKSKLHPIEKEPELASQPEKQRFCQTCGGYSVTGWTCNDERKKTGNETATKNSDDFSKRSLNEQLEANRLYPSPYQATNILCPKSVGHRFCQHCGLNLDWLPIHSVCPKCGHQNFATHPEKAPSTLHETTPNRLDSWMGSFELPKSHALSVGTVRSASLNEMVKKCPICRLRGGCCPDCEKQLSSKHNKSQQNSTTQSSTSDSDVFPRRSMERPKTRPSLRDRFNGFTKKIDKSTRLSSLFKAYGDKKATEHEPSQRRSTRSSIVSLNVEEILKKGDSHKRKSKSQSIELQELDPQLQNNKKATECGSPTYAQIRKNKRSLLQRIKKQNRGKYSYRYGQRYPGIVIGHRECVQQGRAVPPHMGWMWNIRTPGIGKIRKGWRPGAVKKPIKELMQHFLVNYPLDNIPVSKKAARSAVAAESDSGATKQKPTLQIVKRNGEYCVVLNPLKDSELLKTAQDPYLDCEPIRFKIAKDPNTGKLYQLRKSLKMKGFTMCDCMELETCDHRTVKEKKLLKKELRKLSKCLGLPKTIELKDVPNDSESELDLEFTPPSAMLKSGLRKADVVNTETQYSVDDFKVQMPVDKLRCKPGPEAPQHIDKSLKTKENVDARSKDSNGARKGRYEKNGKLATKGALGTRSVQYSKDGARENLADKGTAIKAGAGVKSIAGSKAKATARSKAAVGFKTGTEERNKAQILHQPSLGRVKTQVDPCAIISPSDRCENYAMVSRVCGIQPDNTYCATPCVPSVGFYNTCYN